MNPYTILYGALCLAFIVTVAVIVFTPYDP